MKKQHAHNNDLTIIRILFLLAGIVTPIVTYTWKSVYPDLNNNIFVGWSFSVAFFVLFVLTYINTYVQKYVRFFAYGFFYLSSLSILYFAYINHFDPGYTLLAFLIIFVNSLLFNGPKGQLLHNISIFSVFFVALFLKRQEAILNPIIIILTILIFSVVSFVILKFTHDTLNALFLSHEEISHMAYHDPLTNIPNRNMLQEVLNSVLLDAQKNELKFGILFIDLNNFKEVNDKHGHTIGDKVLVGVAQRLQEVLRENDLVARQGGDEFIILLPAIKDKNNLLEIASRINDLFKQPFYPANNKDIIITTSIGISVYPDDGTTAEQILDFADKSMYEEKSFKNQTCMSL